MVFPWAGAVRNKFFAFKRCVTGAFPKANLEVWYETRDLLEQGA